MIRLGKRYLVVPDLQVREGVPLNHCSWLSHYAMDKAPDVIVFLGDIFDMPSLSSYDKRGSRSAEGKRIRRDVAAGHRALEMIVGPWRKAGWVPEMHVTIGNHEDRWDRALEESPHMLEGMFPNDDPFRFHDYSIRAHPFLKKVTLDGVRYAHFHPEGPGGKVTQTRNGAPNATEQIRRQQCSATAGHSQGLSVGIMETPSGIRRGVIAGSYYLHSEGYMRGLDRQHWRGLVLKNHVRYGQYAFSEVELSWLQAKYRRLEPIGRKVA